MDDVATHKTTTDTTATPKTATPKTKTTAKATTTPPPTYDVAIIGAGIVGAATAYQLSRYQLKILWLERENDVSLGATRANSAIVHAGYDPLPGSQMARLNVEGNRMMEALCETVGAHFDRCGSLVLGFTEQDRSHLRELKARGEQNGVPDLQLLNREETLRLEPAVNPNILAALYAPTAGIILPWELAVALAEIAVREGADLHLNHEVTGLAHDVAWTIRTADRSYRARYVVNAAGQGAEVLHNMVAKAAFHLVPARGEYFLLDKAAEPHPRHVIFQCPGPLGKGVLVAPTIHGNTLVGPNSEVVTDGEDTRTTAAGLAEVQQKALRSVRTLRFGENIRHFAGVRANQEKDDFYIQMQPDGFLDLAAIKSPGLTAAPAIALLALDLLSEAGLQLDPKPNWDGSRQVTHFASLSPAQKAALVARDPSFGRVICRCQSITEGEILAAIHSPIPPSSLDAIKRRTGAGLGRCQGGFCGPRVLEILSRELHIPPASVLQDRAGSYIVLGPNRAADESTTQEADHE